MRRIILPLLMVSSGMSIDIGYETIQASAVNTGSLTSQRVSESPGSVIVISREMINATSAKTLSDLLEIYVPGFQYTINKWNGIVWGMRGSISDQNTKFIVQLDGITLNQVSAFGFINTHNMPANPGIERVEVYLGPASSVYGTGASAGVINIITETKRAVRYGGALSSNAGLAGVDDCGARIEGSISDVLEDNVFSAFVTASVSGGTNRSRIYGFSELASFNPDQGAEIPSRGVEAQGFANSNPESWEFGANYSLGDFIFKMYFSRQVIDLSPYFFSDPWRGVSSNKPTQYDGYTFGNTGDQNGFYSKWSHTNAWQNTSALLALRYEGVWGLGKYAATLSTLSTENVLLSLVKDELRTPSSQFSQSFGDGIHRLQLLNLSEPHWGKLSTGVESSIYNTGRSIFAKNIGSDATTGWQADTRLKAYPEEVLFQNSAFAEAVVLDIGFLDAIGAGIRADVTPYQDLYFSPRVFTSSVMGNHQIRLALQSSINIPPPAAKIPVAGVTGELPNSVYRYTTPQDTNSVVLPAVTKDFYSAVKPERSYAIDLSSTHAVYKGVVVSTSNAVTWYRDVLGWNTYFRVVDNLYDYTDFTSFIDVKYMSKGDHSFGMNSSVSLVLASSYRDSLSLEIAKIRPQLYVPEGTDSASFYTEGKPFEYRPVIDSTHSEPITVNIANPAVAVVSKDGLNPTNLHTVTTKMYWTISFLDKSLLFHNDLRILWGLWGRQDTYGSRFFEAAYQPMFKWDIGARYTFSRGLYLDLRVYDALGWYNLNSLRWQHASAESQGELYSVDNASASVQIGAEF